jgi:ribosomal protein S1
VCGGRACAQGYGGTLDWEELVGKTLEMKILELDQERDRLVMSNRKNTMQSSKTKHAVCARA